MDIKWILIVIVLICVLALVIFLIKRNQKDKDEYVEFLNKTEVEGNDTKPKVEE